MPGDTAAIHSGSLAANSALPTNSNGDTLVEANSIQEAVGLALVGTITVQHAGETLNDSMAPGNVGATIAEHKPFLYSGGAIQLEDMAGSATGSDWDYNDRSWMASAAEVPGGSSSYSYPTMVWITGGAGTNETSASNGWFVVHRNNTVGGLTVNFGVVASAASNTATLDVDYNILGNGSSVTFAAGASEAMIFIHPMIDALHSFEEPFESPIERVTLALSGGTGYTVYTPNEAFIELGNDNLQFDLDVDADGILGADGIDLAKNYLPGYKDGVAMISTGTRFNVPGYQGQRMKLVLNGIGTASADHVLRVEFIIAQVSADPGYTGNRTDPSLEGAGNTEDYSFRRNGREGMDNAVPSKITINRTSAPSDNLSLHGGPYGGKMELNSTWVNFWCKDYGGAARLRADVYIADVNAPNGERLMPDPFGRVALSVPLDDDLITGTNGQTTTGDGIADKWEIAMGKRWALQYGVAEWTDAVALTKFNNAFDDELADPDGAAGPLVEQGKPGPNLPGETGDAHEVKEEYRGYILDGGSGGFTGGHIRLDPARKEILVEADRAAVLNNLPEGGLKGVLNGASGVFSNPTRGAGIYMYWLMDEEELAAPTVLELATDDAMEASRDTAAERQNPTSNRLATDFIHVFFVDANLGNSAATSDRGPLVKRAVGVSISEMNKKYAPGNAYGVVNIPEAYMTVLAHEITHMLVEPGIVGVWDKFEHIVGPAATYQSELMYAAPTKKNRELATVTISTTVQQEMKVKSNQGIV